jgi:3-dehydroquinate synthetase
VKWRAITVWKAWPRIPSRVCGRARSYGEARWQGLLRRRNRLTLHSQPDMSFGQQARPQGSLFRYEVAQFDIARIGTLIVNRSPIFGVEGSSAIADLISGRPAVMFLSPTVEAIYGEALRHMALAAGLDPADVVVVPTSEQSKVIGTVENIIVGARNRNLSRDVVFIAVGGGILLDIVGFAASLFRRGVAHIKIGTTLVAQIDAAVGIKCGVNSSGAKNLIGTFYPPMAVLTDGRFLTTLTRREIRCGLAEMIKLGIIADAELFRRVEAFGTAFLEPAAVESDDCCWLVDRSIVSMTAELSTNPLEEELRRRVDFGHTISPMLEAQTGYNLKHGEAVSIDLALFTIVSRLLGLIDEDEMGRILNLLRRFRLPLWHDLCGDLTQLADAIAATEAHRGRRINQPLPTRIGDATFLEHRDSLPLATLTAAVDRLRRESQR